MKKILIAILATFTLTTLQAAETSTKAPKGPLRDRRIQALTGGELTPLNTAARATKVRQPEFCEWAMRYLEQDANTSTDYIALDFFPGVHTYLDQDNITITPPTIEKTPEGSTPPATDFISKGYSDARLLGKLTPEDNEKLYAFAALICLKNALAQPYKPFNYSRIASVITTKKGSGSKKAFSPAICDIAVLCKSMALYSSETNTKRTQGKLKEIYNQYVPEVRAILSKVGYTQSPIDLTPIK